MHYRRPSIARRRIGQTDREIVIWDRSPNARPAPGVPQSVTRGNSVESDLQASGAVRVVPQAMPSIRTRGNGPYLPYWADLRSGLPRSRSRTVMYPKVQDQVTTNPFLIPPHRFLHQVTRAAPKHHCPTFITSTKTVMLRMLLAPPQRYHLTPIKVA